MRKYLFLLLLPLFFIAARPARADYIAIPPLDHAHVKASAFSWEGTVPFLTFDTSTSFSSGSFEYNQWATPQDNNSGRLNVDLGGPHTIYKFEYANSFGYGGWPMLNGTGCQDFTFWGSNSSGSFNDTTWSDSGWTQIPTGQPKLDVMQDPPPESLSTMTLTNDTAYRYYSIKCSTNWASGGYLNPYSNIGIRRVQLMAAGEAPVPTPTPAPPAMAGPVQSAAQGLILGAKTSALSNLGNLIPKAAVVLISVAVLYFIFRFFFGFSGIGGGADDNYTDRGDSVPEFNGPLSDAADDAYHAGKINREEREAIQNDAGYGN